MTVRLTLMAHGMTGAIRRAAFAADEPLDRDVRAELTGRVPPGHVFAGHGPERRCAQTAEALGLGADVTADSALRDCDFGRWRGRTLAEVQADEPEAVLVWLTDPTAAPHGGESVSELTVRVSDWLSARKDGRQLAITHPALIRAAIVHVLQAPPDAFWRIDVAPLAMVELSGRSGRWNLRFLPANDPQRPPNAPQ